MFNFCDIIKEFNISLNIINLPAKILSLYIKFFCFSIFIY